MAIQFDVGAANALIQTAETADDRLRDEGVLRRGAVETARNEFSGAYADLFEQSAATESGDRGKLSGVLHAVAEQVREAKSKAEEENKRQADLAAWKVRERERERRRQTEAFTELVGAGIDGFFDWKPSESPIAPPTISASFTAQGRTRTAGSSTGKSSAVPEHLRTFVSQSQACNAGMEAQLVAVRNAFARFESSCSWVPIGSKTFLTGFERLLQENQSDVTWISGVAAAFDAAGGNKLSNAALDLAATAVSPMTDEALLAALASLPAADITAMLAGSPGLQSQLQLIDPAVIHGWWQGMHPLENSGEAFSARQDLLLTTLPVLFGNLEGIPYGARDVANRLALKTQIADLKAQIEQAKGLSDGISMAGPYAPPSLANIKQSVLDMQSQLAALQNIEKAAATADGKVQRYLISMTGHHPPLAAVSIGDLDTATSVTYAVPGMGATSHDTTGWTKGAQNLHSLLPKGSAVVAWIGYETPPVPSVGNPDFGVLDVNRAVAGGNNLGSALRGFAAVRGSDMPNLNIVAHSYGTTTAAVALSQPGGVHVDNFITLGSAGLPDSVQSAADLNATNVYSGHARDKLPFESESGDQWAWTGRDTSRDHHVNPMSPDFGSKPFGVESGGDAGRIVTDHNTLMGDSGPAAGYLDQETESLRNTANAISGNPDKITEHKPLGPTDFQKAMEASAYAY